MSDWTVNSERFEQPATKGEVALAVMRIQRLGMILVDVIRSDKTDDDKYNALNKFYDETDDYMRTLVGGE